MKASHLFRQLGEEHRRAVAAANRLRAAMGVSRSLDEEMARFLKTWRDEILPHQRKEEEVLLPDLAQQISEADAVITLTLIDHVVLRRLVREVEHAADGRRCTLLSQLTQRLEENVRFEEQTLFPAMQEALGRTRLAALGDELAQRTGDFAVGPPAHDRPSSCLGARGAILLASQAAFS